MVWRGMILWEWEHFLQKRDTSPKKNFMKILELQLTIISIVD